MKEVRFTGIYGWKKWIYIVELFTKVEGHYYTIRLGRAAHYSAPTLIYHMNRLS